MTNARAQLSQIVADMRHQAMEAHVVAIRATQDAARMEQLLALINDDGAIKLLDQLADEGLVVGGRLVEPSKRSLLRVVTDRAAGRPERV